LPKAVRWDRFFFCDVLGFVVLVDAALSFEIKKLVLFWEVTLSLAEVTIWFGGTVVVVEPTASAIKPLDAIPSCFIDKIADGKKCRAHLFLSA
jgi:hypothetical protein